MSGDCTEVRKMWVPAKKNMQHAFFIAQVQPGGRLLQQCMCNICKQGTMKTSFEKIRVAGLEGV
ncbi:uncharacterized protein PHALS_15340 [Plasmopara halstedii]|uniref:Uncharacterized protein n=1 Tax=Plasmopara halstedii TaxID=4781 RepID=A0A0P1AE12_PLAHL|nr:uncharacterized protein PHALS_15340 [Plasmopara halstedii]CEG38863.1 hypothetical protein PHALS_15340 [Plasmopara halstedii]|eukprot:XP_024575232.1 hypothetical protein PHALS_15340 [Plasmopara halstedii]